ncbi:hypothetical protein L1987_03159 [Smallanthus sonchifolius]|uniref:Uncharacterized protein n=1 Tax=Smallanthus sonchifolius TaxID=185202 RepID=A0ACB9KA00_9ASTR|nr:hypothetical protein L1987_03159 [Smallanthus sonchifolius]
MFQGKMKKQKRIQETQMNPFDFVSEEIVFAILDCLFDRKPFSLVSKTFYAIESRHRRTLKPFPRTTSDHHQLKRLLNRYPSVTHLDLSLCPRVTDSCLSHLSNSCLKSIDLSRSKLFTHVGLSNLVSKCANLVDIDLSNGVHLNDTAAAAVASCGSLERLCLSRCKALSLIYPLNSKVKTTTLVVDPSCLGNAKNRGVGGR